MERIPDEIGPVPRRDRLHRRLEAGQSQGLHRSRSSSVGERPDGTDLETTYDPTEPVSLRAIALALSIPIGVPKTDLDTEGEQPLPPSASPGRASAAPQLPKDA